MAGFIAPLPTCWRVIDPISEVTVSTKGLFVSALVGWPLAVFTLLATRAISVESSVLAPEYLAWLFLACAPVVTLLIIVRGRSSQSVAHVLYETERSGVPAGDGSADVTRV